MFANAQRLKAHLKVHDQQTTDLHADPSSAKRRRRSSTGSGKLVRVSGGEAGRDFDCEDEQCGKRFKSKYAMKTHLRTAHLALKPFVCPECDISYAHKANLTKHLTTHHAPEVDTKPTVDEGDVDRLTGATYAEREYRRYGCPVAFMAVKMEPGLDGCDERFWRVYDVRRHLKGVHGFELDDVEVRRILLDAGETEGLD